MAFKVTEGAYQRTYSEELVQWSKSVFNSIQVGILVIDAETKTVVDINPAAALMIGSYREEIIGNSCTLYGCFGSKKDKCPIIDLGLDIENEICTLNRKDGSKLDVMVAITSALRNNKRYLIKSFVDVTSCNGGKEDWTGVEKLLSGNITDIKNIYKSNCVKTVKKIKQDLHKALSMMMGE